MAFDIAKFTARFVEEAREHVASLNRGLVALEQRPDDADVLNEIFRSAHTIKGASRMLRLPAITEVAHRLEDALGALRERRIAASRPLADLLFRGLDAIAALVEQAAGGLQAVPDTAALCEALARAAAGAPQAEPAVAPEPAAAAPEPPPVPAAAPSKPVAETIRVTTGKLDDLIRLMGEVVSHQSKLKQRILELGELERAARRQIELLRQQGGGVLLEYARSQHAGLRQLLAVLRQDKALQDALTAEFQEKALRLRMVPVSLAFDPLGRLARDLAASLGKQVDFVVEGGEIELDKKMVEQLGDPLLHLLRNALDHGVEGPEQRQRAGKPPRARVGLSARYESGSILIELSDDGAGIPIARIREQALSRKMFDAETLAAMDETSLVDLIFQPGFSTSTMITDISGRGVGLDVVRRNIVEDLKGTVRVATRAGRGSTFAIRLPLTLAIMRVLLVAARGRVFGISSHYVTEMLRVPAAEVIAVVTRRALRLREEFVPVVDLADLLDGAAAPPRAGQLLVIIVGVGNEKMGFIVDAIPEEEDLVIKALPDLLAGVRLVSGVTSSGRNEVVAVLNVPAVMEAAKTAAAAGAAPVATAARERETRILVVDDSITTREIERDILEAYGYRVTIAGDGIEALEKAAGTPFDLVITDVEMPRLNGFVLTKRLRADPAYRDVPIIIVTSREKDEDKRRGIAVGASAYIVKGAFEQSNLVETVQNLIGRGGT
jgi:chemotaxis protein histidine kinase CheA